MVHSSYLINIKHPKSRHLTFKSGHLPDDTIALAVSAKVHGKSRRAVFLVLNI